MYNVIPTSLTPFSFISKNRHAFSVVYVCVCVNMPLCICIPGYTVQCGTTVLEYISPKLAPISHKAHHQLHQLLKKKTLQLQQMLIYLFILTSGCYEAWDLVQETQFGWQTVLNPTVKHWKTSYREVRIRTKKLHTTDIFCLMFLLQREEAHSQKHPNVIMRFDFRPQPRHVCFLLAYTSNVCEFAWCKFIYKSLAWC